MNKIGPGLMAMINDCNTIIVTEESKKESWEAFKKSLYEIPEYKEPVFTMSVAEYKLFDEWIKNNYNH